MLPEEMMIWAEFCIKECQKFNCTVEPLFTNHPNKQPSSFSLSHGADSMNNP